MTATEITKKLESLRDEKASVERRVKQLGAEIDYFVNKLFLKIDKEQS